MHKSIIMTAVSLSFVGWQGVGLSAAHAAAARSHVSATNLQCSVAPQQARTIAQSEGTSSGHTMYGRHLAAPSRPAWITVQSGTAKRRSTGVDCG